MDEKFNEKEKEMTGIYARLFQHELDHLKGFTILNWRICHNGLEYKLTNESEDAIDIQNCVKEYYQKIQEKKSEYPEHFQRLGRLINLNTNDHESDNNEYFDLNQIRKKNQLWDFEEDYRKKLQRLFGRYAVFQGEQFF
jgi:predicted SprT family Zn-dependent metalloprotease